MGGEGKGREGKRGNGKEDRASHTVAALGLAKPRLSGRDLRGWLVHNCKSNTVNYPVTLISGSGC